MHNKEMLDKLASSFGTALKIEGDNFYDILVIENDKLHELCNVLKEEWGFNYLVNLSAVDFKDRFEVIYHIHSIPENNKIAVKTLLNRDEASVATVSDIWKTADWQEREVFDLMGITFTGHPNLIRILLPDDFDGHPLRKDFKLN